MRQATREGAVGKDVSSALFSLAPSPFSRHYNTSCKLVYTHCKEKPGYEAGVIDKELRCEV